jgi:predicted nucleic acid-binding protein
MTRRTARKTFLCDTSVLVAASDAAHQHHAQSVAVVSRATPETAFCAAHALAELYSTLSGGRYLRVLPLTQVLQIVKQVQTVFTIVDVSHRDYVSLLESAVLRQIRNGRVYDALHVHAAEQCGADIIYTWNESDVRAVASEEWAERIQTP